jgi:tetraacyldisaccharide 4'-kinase
VALRNQRLERGWEPVQRLRWPVVSIGNLSTGGAGKTPLAIALAKALAKRGIQVDVLSRGYGRQSRLPARVRTDGTSEEFGDEPMLIALDADVPVYVASRRYQAGLLAEAGQAESGGPRVHLLDDGFQHRQLHRDIDILLLDSRDWSDSLLPAGNLREPLEAARRATVIAISADEPQLERELLRWRWKGPIWRIERSMEVPEVDGPAIAFCGIARPEQFFRGLEVAGMHIAERFVFPDHHRFSAANLKSLAEAGQKAGAVALVTTEKDRIRLQEIASALPDSLPLKTARLSTQICREEEAIDWLEARLRSTQ